jgi:hypothetical protein
LKRVHTEGQAFMNRNTGDRGLGMELKLRNWVPISEIIQINHPLLSGKSPAHWKLVKQITNFMLTVEED